MCWHLSRIRAHPIYLTIQIVCVQQLYTLFRYIINTYIMHKCTLILCIITHSQRFSDNEMYANWPRTVAPCDGSRIHPCGGAAVRVQLAHISSSEKRCKCVIIHNISVHLCIMYVLIMYLNSVYGCCIRTIWILKKMRWARILDKCPCADVEWWNEHSWKN